MKRKVSVFIVLVISTLILGYYSSTTCTNKVQNSILLLQDYDYSIDDRDYTILIKNDIGEISVQDDDTASSFIGAIEDNRRVVTTNANCPFTNEVIIKTGNEVIKRFKIADDGCFTALREDNEIIRLPEDLYKSMEEYMKLGSNSLDSSRRKKK